MPRRKPAAPPAPVRTLPVYLDLEIGGGSKRQLLRTLDKQGCYVGPCAQEMILRPSFTIAERARGVRLARAQLHVLGFTDWATWGDVLKAAAKVGGEKLPPEVAARLWLRLPDRQPGDHFWTLMDPIERSDGEPCVFYLVCHDDGERRLLGRHVSPSRRFFPHREVVFGLRE